MKVPALTPALRHLRDFQTDVLAFFSAMEAPSGIAAFPLGVRRAFLITDPDVVADAIDHPALVRDRRALGPLGSFGGYAPIHAVIGDGLPLLGNPLAKERRARVGRALADAQRAHLTRGDSFATLLADGPDGPDGPDGDGNVPGDGDGDGDGITDLVELVTRSVLQRLCVRSFGDACADEVADLAHALEATTRAGHHQSVGAPLWASWWGEDVRDLVDARRTLENFAKRILDNPALKDAPTLRAFADVPRELQVDEIITHVLAGTETTSLAICWTIWLLAAHPQWQARAIANADEVAAGTLDLERLRLGSDVPLAQCVREALRLYPSFWQLFRVAEAPCRLGGGGGDGDGDAVEIAVGDVVFCCLYLAHRRPGRTDAPDAFVPDRRDSGPFLSFGVGTRSCIGARLGFTMVMETVADLLLHHTITPTSTTRPVEALVHGLHRHGGFPVRIAPRG